MKVSITYFKQSGKYYSEGHYHTKKEELWKIFEEACQMLKEGKRPGLVDGPCEFYAVILCREHPNDHPFLFVPENYIFIPKGES